MRYYHYTFTTIQALLTEDAAAYAIRRLPTVLRLDPPDWMESEGMRPSLEGRTVTITFYVHVRSDVQFGELASAVARLQEHVSITLLALEEEYAHFRIAVEEYLRANRDAVRELLFPSEGER